MASVGELHILGKISDLVKRCGISPTVADIELHFHSSNESHECFYSFGGVDGIASNPEEAKKVAKVWSLLGLDEAGFRRVGTLIEAEKIVDHALSQVPRSHLR